MCGCTGVASPACRLRRLRRCQTECAVSRVPYRPGNSASDWLEVPGVGAFSMPASCVRSPSQCSSASRAALPRGTVRRLLPLPCT